MYVHASMYSGDYIHLNAAALLLLCCCCDLNITASLHVCILPCTQDKADCIIDSQKINMNTRVSIVRAC